MFSSHRVCVCVCLSVSVSVVCVVYACSVACAIMGLYAEAVSMMQRAVQLSGMAHPLACRACGIMTYLYDDKRGGKERSLVTHTHSFTYLQPPSHLPPCWPPCCLFFSFLFDDIMLLLLLLLLRLLLCCCDVCDVCDDVM
jgi:hypothetical protein